MVIQIPYIHILIFSNPLLGLFYLIRHYYSLNQLTLIAMIGI